MIDSYCMAKAIAAKKKKNKFTKSFYKHETHTNLES